MPLNDPTDLAIRVLTETRERLRLLITSSESFDYPAAKLALRELEESLRKLARTQFEIEQQARRPSALAAVIPFPLENSA